MWPGRPVRIRLFWHKRAVYGLIRGLNPVSESNRQYSCGYMAFWERRIFCPNQTVHLFKQPCLFDFPQIRKPFLLLLSRVSPVSLVRAVKLELWCCSRRERCLKLHCFHNRVGYERERERERDQWVNCLAQEQNDRFFSLSARGFMLIVRRDGLRVPGSHLL